MKKTFKHLFVSSWLSVALLAGSSLYAAEAKPKGDGKTTEETKPKRDWYPFYGTVASVDKVANTLALKKKEGVRVIKLDAKSELEINGKPATLGGVKVGDYAHGTLHKDGTGNEVVLAAKFDKVPPEKDKVEASKKVQETPVTKPKQ